MAWKLIEPNLPRLTASNTIAQGSLSLIARRATWAALGSVQIVIQQAESLLFLTSRDNERIQVLEST